MLIVFVMYTSVSLHIKLFYSSSPNTINHYGNVIVWKALPTWFNCQTTCIISYIKYKYKKGHNLIQKRFTLFELTLKHKLTSDMICTIFTM